MASAAFASRLKEDGSVAVPSTAIAALGLHPGDEVHVQLALATENNEPPEATRLEYAIRKMMHRTAQQVAAAQSNSIETYPPVRTVPSGKTLADVVSGKWPGDETDTQILEALKALS